MEGSKKGKVCVTGGAGYFASHLIMRLLQHGYSVRATVRSDPKFKEDTTHLKALPNASENLEIFDADLSRPDNFEAAIDGCIGVFHTAHPILFDAEDPESMVIKPALEGMRGILRACMDSKTVKRVVYTSSASAVAFNGQDLKEMDESVWTDVQFCRAQDVPIKSYFISKTLTEKAALEFAEENGVDLVTVAPSSVVGPFLVAHYPGCFATSMALIRGDREQCKVLKQMQFVHIDDLASAHIFLLECEQAKGRYICSSNDTTIHTLAEFLSNRFPEFQMPMDILSEMEKEEPVHLSSKKLFELGFKFKYGLEEMFDGAIECCKRKGFL
ncbi:noscapine synthase SDR1-like [Magnolia sinica]|uniref:noscapine synthase SDR1-like n=1 Tax=Magnolia sinica TaxID=86752 RepID=UPI0026588945|nr:noscapine synthase SDR1-like [Magnolia sinica]